MVILGVENEAELIQWEEKLKAQGIPCEAFIEPDLLDQKTALAIHPSADHKLFKKLTLYNPVQSRSLPNLIPT